jgi:FMN-dependent oxidoreductase (nitrilotriacetate monooxygenase family)
MTDTLDRPKKRIRLNGFKQSTVSHSAVGLWRHPNSQAQRYTDLDYWTETARTLERGRFDALFIADALGPLDTYQGRMDATLRQGVQTPSDDPLLVVSAMAAVTRNLGFAVTLSTAFEQPYLLARKMTTLDHLTRGRIGWNIVNSALDSAARNCGQPRQLPHDERYDVAEEFLQVAYKLWEGSWEDGAVLRDRAGGVFADPAKVHGIGHRGKYFSVPGAFLCEPSIQRTPALFQAGTSGRGRAFAAAHAEGVFLSTLAPEPAARLVADVRRLAAEAGRDPRALRFFGHVTVITAATDDEARAKHRDYLQWLSEEGNLARHCALIQLDLSTLDPDEPLEYVQTEGIRSVLASFTKADPTRRWTVREMSRHLATSMGGVTLVGSPATVADQLEHWMDAADLDGFNVSDPMPLASYDDFIEHVRPELLRRGRTWDDYEGATLREYLAGPGQARVSADHPAAAHRR